MAEFGIPPTLPEIYVNHGPTFPVSPPPPPSFAPLHFILRCDISPPLEATGTVDTTPRHRVRGRHGRRQEQQLKSTCGAGCTGEESYAGRPAAVRNRSWCESFSSTSSGCGGSCGDTVMAKPRESSAGDGKCEDRSSRINSSNRRGFGFLHASGDKSAGDQRCRELGSRGGNHSVSRGTECLHTGGDELAEYRSCREVGIGRGRSSGSRSIRFPPASGGNIAGDRSCRELGSVSSRRSGSRIAPAEDRCYRRLGNRDSKNSSSGKRSKSSKGREASHDGGATAAEDQSWRDGGSGSVGSNGQIVEPHGESSQMRSAPHRCDSRTRTPDCRRQRPLVRSRQRRRPSCSRRFAWSRYHHDHTWATFITAGIMRAATIAVTLLFITTAPRSASTSDRYRWSFVAVADGAACTPAESDVVVTDAESLADLVDRTNCSGELLD